MKLYTPLINKALDLAYNAHHGQVDKSCVPYIYHPVFVASQMDTEEEIIAALLHDVLEVTAITLEELKGFGFSQNALDAVVLLTHIRGQDYMEYIQNLAGNAIAIKVKLADLRHNMNPGRIANEPSENRDRRMQKYREAIELLEQLRYK